MTTQQYMYLVDIRFAQGQYYTLSHLYRVQQTVKYTQSKGISGMIQIPNTLKLQDYRDYRFLRKPEVKPSAPERVSVSCLKQNTTVELQNSSNDKFYILPTIISNMYFYNRFYLGHYGSHAFCLRPLVSSNIYHCCLPSNLAFTYYMVAIRIYQGARCSDTFKA